MPINNETNDYYGPLVGAIDEGTSSARFLVFASKTSEVLTYHQIKITQKYPQEGWVEQDPIEILNKVKECIEKTIDNLTKLAIDPSKIVTIGITNQRETTVVWDSKTGIPLYNAIVWLDTRTSATVDKLISGKKDKNYLKQLCGLPISTYFSAVKLKWLIENVPEISYAIRENRCMVGTIDTWLIWNLTGGINGGIYITDVTNASRTMLMNIETLKWDKELCNFFDIPIEILPSIKSCSEIYGYLSDTSLQGIPLSGCLGDQQAALIGQMCLHRGQAKSTYGTGCFLLYNTGNLPIQSTHGLLTTVGYKLGKNKPVVYALEGSVAIAGAAIEWLQANLGLISNVHDSERIAETVQTTGDVYFVPAFSGLYAPYWRKDARSIICGLTEETKPGHIIRSALESICFQIRDILEAMTLDCGFHLTKLLADGGMTENNLLMQLQADLCGIPVVRSSMLETTALGAAMAAGYAEGINAWDIEATLPILSEVFNPSINEDARDIRYSRWKMAVEKSLDWTNLPEEDENNDRLKRIIASIPGSIYITTSVAILIISNLINSQY